MEPTGVLVTGLLYAAAQVYKKAQDEAAASVWNRLKTAWEQLFGGEPSPSAMTTGVVRQLADSSPDLSQALAKLKATSPVLRRLERNADCINGARILWIDDNPHWNEWERGYLEAAGGVVRTAERSESALAQLAGGFDLIISDIAREGNPTEGLDLLPVLTRAAPGISVVFYVGVLLPAGTPPGAFGITNRPDELLHLCLDVLERWRP